MCQGTKGDTWPAQEKASLWLPSVLQVGPGWILKGCCEAQVCARKSHLSGTVWPWNRSQEVGGDLHPWRFSKLGKVSHKAWPGATASPALRILPTAFLQLY